MKIFTLLFYVLVGILAVYGVPTGNLRGAVRDPTGAAISNAFVLVHWDNDGAIGASAGPEDLRLTTGKRGEFSAELAPGFYDVALFAHGFSPAARKVRITTGKTVNYEVNLPIDPGILAEFGDKFFENPVPVEPLPNPKP